MNCFTVGTMSLDHGIEASASGRDWTVKVGFQPRQEVPIARRRVEMIEGFLHALEKRARGDTRFIHALDCKEEGQVPVENAKEALEELKGGVGLFDLDFDEERRLLIDSPHCKNALVLVTTCVNREGQLVYLSNAFDEVERDGRTVKVNKSFDHAAGVTVCAQGQGFYGETHSLLRLTPGAGFRLRQTHPYAAGWEELILTWNGRMLKHRQFSTRKNPRA